MSLKMKGSNDHMEQPIRVAIYARVSTEQAEFGYSIDAQLDTLRSTATCTTNKSSENT